MDELLEELREELANIYRRIRAGEDRLVMLSEEARDIVGRVETQKNEIKELYEMAGQLEDKIYRLSS